MSNDQILEAKSKHMQSEENEAELFVLLGRFCSENEGIGKLHLVPEYLSEYVRYKEPKELPDMFINICNHAQPLQMLRIVLGMYPEDLNL